MTENLLNTYNVNEISLTMDDFVHMSSQSDQIKWIPVVKMNIDIVDTKEAWSIPSGIVAMLVGCIFIYSIMFATGNFIYGETVKASMLLVVTVISGFILLKLWKKIKANVL